MQPRYCWTCPKARAALAALESGPHPARRFWLTLMNLVVAAAGLAMVGWAVKMYVDVKHAKHPPASHEQMLWASLPLTAAHGQSIWCARQPRLVPAAWRAQSLSGRQRPLSAPACCDARSRAQVRVAFGGTGLFTSLTALAGFVGVAAQQPAPAGAVLNDAGHAVHLPGAPCLRCTMPLRTAGCSSPSSSTTRHASEAALAGCAPSAQGADHGPHRPRWGCSSS